MRHRVAWSFASALLLILNAVSCIKTETDEVREIIERQEILFCEAPMAIPSYNSTDAPLLGNGYTGIAIGGPPQEQTFYISRNDFWRLESAYDGSFPLSLGMLKISSPSLVGATYRLEQSLYDATTISEFRKDELTLRSEIYVAAKQDIMHIRLKAEGQGEVEGSIELTLPKEDKVRIDERGSGSEQDIKYIWRGYSENVDIPTKAAVALRADGCTDGKFKLKAGEYLDIICSFSSNFKSDNCLETVIGRLSALKISDLEMIRKEHEQWWRDFWNKSYVSIDDADIEEMYYLSLYGMASCSRDADFPPGIFGTWITDEVPSWFGDYHLNYNHMAPFYALYSSNRIEQAEPYYAPILAFMDRGKHYSNVVAGIPEGIMLPVGIGPLGIESTRLSAKIKNDYKDWITSGNIQNEGLFWGQKSNSSYALVNLAMQFYLTWDMDFAKKVYPFVKGVATFWENYLVFEDGRYVIYNDSVHEGAIGTMNPILSLGLVHMVMKLASNMSEFIGVDADRRESWMEKSRNLSAYPLQEKDGKTVFRYTEKGVDWWPDNTLGIQHIYPAGEIGLNSDPELLQIARNTIDALGRWNDFNGTNSFFPAAARVGYPAEKLLEYLKEYSRNRRPNGFRNDNPHGIENLSTVPNTVNEMLCTGHQGILRLFPVWPVNKDASFRNIRTDGAFLVSATLKDRMITDVELFSEQGRNLVMLNPWNGAEIEIVSSKGEKQRLLGDTLRIATSAGERYLLKPV